MAKNALRRPPAGLPRVSWRLLTRSRKRRVELVLELARELRARARRLERLAAQLVAVLAAPEPKS